MSKLKIYRKKAGLTRSDLAIQVNKTISAIGHYETGIRTPAIDDARKIVDVLNDFGAECTLDDVFPPKDKAA